MTNDFVLEVHTGSSNGRPRCPGLEPVGKYWKAYGDRTTMLRYSRRLRRRGFRTLVYPVNCDRSTNYRTLFFSSYPADKDGRYHCVYCGNKLTSAQVTVDHVVPVGAVKRSKRLQKKFKYTGVNTVENLVPACRACNRYKGANRSVVWRVRARLGKWRGYFVIKRLLLFAMAVFAFYKLYVNVLAEYISKWINSR